MLDFISNFAWDMLSRSVHFYNVTLQPALCILITLLIQLHMLYMDSNSAVFMVYLTDDKNCSK